MTEVELIYDRDCPNIRAARTNLLRAFAAEDLTPRWREWDRNASSTPAHVRAYGSPTIVVDGRDVDGAEPGETAEYCRIYEHATGAGVAPSVQRIRTALRNANTGNPHRRPSPRSWKMHLAVAPGIGAALLPKLVCPACWPAYAGLLSSLGLGFVDYTPYLLALTLGFLAIALGALAYRARARRGYGPLALGAGASLFVVAGKFAYESDWLMYLGLGVLVAASLWNTWPRRRKASASCPSCVPLAVSLNPTEEG